MIAELGDVLWYVARAAAELDVHPSDVAKDNIEKLKSRKERNVLGGSGDER
jgi:NTP pyrophosphatase (non-canonical NTP hydrolase)